MARQTFHPYPYQAFAIQQILEKPAVGLFLDMGMGKTVITLTALQELLYDSFDISRVLVIAPKRVAETTWTDEVQKWEHLKDLTVVPILGSVRQRKAALKQKAEIYVINRENVVWLVETLGRYWFFDAVVIDEASSFKNHQARRFKALKTVRPRVHRMIELTGTPMPNGLMDLWSELFLLDRGERLGKTIGEYRRRYFTPGYGSGFVTYVWNPLPTAQQDIEAKISDICVSMKSEDYLDLPPLIYNEVKVKLSKSAMKQYRELERDFILQLDGSDIVASSAAALSGKLLQLANGAVYNEQGEVSEIHDAKLDALKELVDANEHKPILVFYWFQHDLKRLQKAFPYGKRLDSAERIHQWNEGKIRMLFVHPASAGHGLNLQFGGNIIVWYGLSWSLELYQQANKRLHRTGQKHTVVVHHLIAEGTIDEQVMDALSKKKVTQDDILEAVKARIGLWRK